MVRYIKLAADGSDLPDDATNHLAVRVEHDLLARPLIVTAHLSDQAMRHAAAIKWAQGLDIYGWSWRLPTVEEAFMIPDRARSESPALDPKVFPNCEGEWIWTATLDAQPPAGFAWGVGLVGGGSYRFHLGGRIPAFAVRAGQF